MIDLPASITRTPNMLVSMTTPNLRSGFTNTAVLVPGRPPFLKRVLDCVRILAEVRKKWATHVVVTGGEPMIQPDIVRLSLPMPGDVDGDGDVDSADVALITAARGQPANGPFDPRNLNGDAVIDINDARLATLACTRAHCAQQ